MELLSKYDIVIFDCDGVIMDVNNAKSEAFGIAVEGYPQGIIAEFVNHCKNTFGISRYVKFKEFFNFAKEPFQEIKYNDFLIRYANICRAIYENAEFTPGFLDLLKELNRLNKIVCVASGSDEKELQEIFLLKGILNKFNGVYGSPKTKSECTSQILGEYTNKKAVFIGDAFSDMKTAKKFSIDFIYMSQYTVQSKEQDKVCREEAIKIINSLEELL